MKIGALVLALAAGYGFSSYSASTQDIKLVEEKININNSGSDKDNKWERRWERREYRERRHERRHERW